MKKILILGSTGMLGHQVTKYFLQFNEYEVIDIAYRKKLREETILLDVKKEDLLSEVIVDINPHIIINCIGLLMVASNNDPMNAIYINSYFPHKLKNIAKNINAKVVHISTDCVFSGKKGHYTEYDITDGEDMYAKTKILGELIDDTNITIRTSLIGPELHDNSDNLFEWFMKQHGTINGFKNAIWSGVTTFELAKGIKWAVENNINGLYHFTNNQSINKYDLLHLFKKHTEKEIEIIETHGKNIDKSLIDTRGEINYPIPTYDQMVRDMVHALDK
jgi:dTDP-4-dehydrorhamnose reductase